MTDDVFDDLGKLEKVLGQRDRLITALESAFAIADLEWRFQGAHPHRLAVLNEMQEALDYVRTPQFSDMTKLGKSKA